MGKLMFVLYAAVCRFGALGIFWCIILDFQPAKEHVAWDIFRLLLSAGFWTLGDLYLGISKEGKK